MAGKTMAFLETALPKAAIVRTMPNTPAAIGRGITVAVGNRGVTAAGRKLAHALLAASGSVEWVDDENLMDAVTAVSGSGPAYIFLLAESLARAGVSPRAFPAPLLREARARNRVRLGRTAAPVAARCGDAASERHFAGRHHQQRRCRC